jgi:hypothetical protein
MSRSVESIRSAGAATLPLVTRKGRRTMNKTLTAVVMAALVATLLTATASPSSASWVSTNCTKGSSADDHVRRKDAQAYAAVAFGEGYEWGGGCWNDNGRDDTPGQPDSNGEGPDCSGFVFKSWELKNSVGSDGFTFWDKLKNMHGPYTSTSFHAPASGWPFYKLPDKSRSTTLYMDAFAKDGHIGMLYTSSNPSANTDWIAEALGDSSGTDENEQGYRYDADYVAVRRYDWTADCYPNCDSQGSTVPVE